MKLVGTTGRFPSVADAIAVLQPNYPVHCVRPSELADAVDAFVDGFPGDTLYAVKCNAHPMVLWRLCAAGIRHFDVASDTEIDLVRRHCPGATIYYHHPAKTAASIRAAYDKAFVRHFAVDCREELAKVIANTGQKAAITVRMAVPQENSVYDLSTKFGAPFALARQLVQKAAEHRRSVGITFHVGSQCLHPIAYDRAMRLAAEVVRDTNIVLDYVDVGGGFPGYYEGTDAPPLTAYFDQIKKTATELWHPRRTRLMCEPGRALVYKAGSLLTQVVLRKDDIIYLNDGIFGGLAEIYWGGSALTVPCRVYRPGGTVNADRQAYTVYGPTCDGNDRLPYRVNLPSDLRDGDWVEFQLLGAYGREMATRYNGLRSEEVVVIEDLDRA